MSNMEMLALLMTISESLRDSLNEKNQDLKDIRISTLGLFINDKAKELLEKC